MKLSRGVSVGEETQKYLLSDHQFVCLFVFFNKLIGTKDPGPKLSEQLIKPWLCGQKL